MSRQKVPDDKRQRTAQACDYCKRRKQKCNGGRPCVTCSKKTVTCTYAAGSSKRDASSPPKRRHIEKAAETSSASAAAARTLRAPRIELEAKPHVWGRRQDGSIDLRTSRQRPQPTTTNQPTDTPDTPEGSRRFYSVADQALEDHTRTSTTSGQDEEAVLLHTTRLLQDQTGRLLYIGDSATLSYLHLFRLMVESISGHSAFTTDPRKENIVENVVSLPPEVRPPCMLADRQTADVLVESFFTNTSGLVEIFDRREFFADLDACYAHPLSASNHFLCLLFLTFAIGLVMATPDPNTAEEVIVRRLHSQPFDQAELFYRSAKCLCDPLSGLEDADFWSVQALSLVSIYMLAVSKRNAAFAYHGMAVRSAIALGLHREETMVNFTGSKLHARCNIWKSLYVLDRFIAASLGRPSAINEDECTEAALKDAFAPHISSILGQQSGSGIDADNVSPSKATEAHMLGVNATVRSCRIIGNILKKLYARRRVSTRVTQDIVQQCDIWSKDLHECLRWHGTKAAAGTRDRGPPRPSLPRAQSMAILHVNLLYCHSVILLTRPFFLFLIQADLHGTSRVTQHLHTRTEKFSEVCITASYHTITMIQSALESKYLPQRNPFVMYFLFTAALLIMSNEFVALFHNPIYGTYIDQAISIMEYFATADPQGKRLLWILRALQDVVVKQASDDTLAHGNARPFRYQYPKTFFNGTIDPVESFFTSPLVPSSGTVLGKRSSSGSGGAPLFHVPPPPGMEMDGHIHIDPSFFRRHSSNTSYQTTFMGIPSALTPATTVTTTTGSPPAIGMVGANTAIGSSRAALARNLSSSPDTGNHNVPSPLTFGGEGDPLFRSAVSPTFHPPILPSPYPLSTSSQPSLAYTSSVGAGAGTAATKSPSYYRPMDSKASDPDGSDSIGTDGDGFDFDCLWNWPNTALGPDGIAGAVANDVSIGEASHLGGGRGGGGAQDVRDAQDYTNIQMPGSSSGNVVQYMVGERGGEGSRGVRGPGQTVVLYSSKQGPPAASDLPPVYSPYGISLSAGGSGTGTPRGGLLTTPLNVPLYPTADFR